MGKEIHDRLREIENAYYDGATYEALSEQIVRTARLVSALEQSESDRHVCETFAPLLWGGVSGTSIEPGAVQAALEGPDGPSYLRSWSAMGRVLLAHRAAA